MRTWFTSDTHLCHKNIIKYCKRPFKNLAQMDRVIIKNWNKRVRPDDTVIFLGDFAWQKNYAEIKKKYLQRLNGNITFVKGNHDHSKALNPKIRSLVIEIGGKKIFCTHNPTDINVLYGINLVGHIHDLWKTKKVVRDGHTTNLVNVGVDVNGFRPISINEIMKTIETNKKKRNK